MLQPRKQPWISNLLEHFHHFRLKSFINSILFITFVIRVLLTSFALSNDVDFQALIAVDNVCDKQTRLKVHLHAAPGFQKLLQWAVHSQLVDLSLNVRAQTNTNILSQFLHNVIVMIHHYFIESNVCISFTSPWRYCLQLCPLVYEKY